MNQSNTEKRDLVVGFRVNKTERKLLDEKVKKSNKSLNQFLLDCIFTDPVLTEQEEINRNHNIELKELFYQIRQDLLKQKTDFLEGLKVIMDE